MSVDMDQADRSLGPQRFQDRMGDRMIASDGQRDDAGCRDLPVEGLDILMAGFQTEPAAHGDIADVGYPTADHRGHPERMFEGADPLDRPNGAGAMPGARPVGDAEVHRYPDQGEIQLRQSGSGPIGGSQEGGDIRKRPFPPVAITELLLGHPAESRVVNIATFGVTVPLAERLQ